jgi:glyoxylase-like metal-dependent hydrolase (beta-lactamase superfamily II)
VKPETFRFQVGSCSCVAILDNAVRYPITMFLRNLPRETYVPLLLARGQDPDYLDLPYICLLIEIGRERVLIDTGGGTGGETPGRLLPNLRALNVEPHQINRVILTHAHGDHIRGCLNEDGTPVFRNARHVIFREEWNFWMSNPTLDELPVDDGFKEKMRVTARKNLDALGAQLDIVSPNAELDPGVTALEAFGHSLGHMAIEIASRDERLLFVADAFVHPLHVEYPETIGITDHRPSGVVTTRLALIENAIRGPALVASSHFPFPGVGRIVAARRGWRWQSIETP